MQNTLQPSQVNAPKWNPAAGSPHTRHNWFICKMKIADFNFLLNNLNMI